MSATECSYGTPGTCREAAVLAESRVESVEGRLVDTWRPLCVQHGLSLALALLQRNARYTVGLARWDHVRPRGQE